VDNALTFGEFNVTTAVPFSKRSSKTRS